MYSGNTLSFPSCQFLKTAKFYKFTAYTSIFFFNPKPYNTVILTEKEILLMFIQKFSMDNANPRYLIWGVGNDERFYFHEWLPAFFSRELQFTSLHKSAMLCWIFTGKRGRVELRREGEQLILRQIYTNSFALFPQDPFTVPGRDCGRHPERVFAEDSVSLPTLHSLRLVYDRDMNLSVFADDNLVLHQHSLLDLTQHQLCLRGKYCFVSGVLTGPEPFSACPQPHPEKIHQEIIGFGGIASTLSYQELSETGKKMWWDYVRSYNLLIQREYPSRRSMDGKTIHWDDLSLAVPHYYGNNFPVGEISDFQYNKTIQDMGGSVWFEFWFYPDFVYQEGKLQPQKVVEQILDYCIHAREKTGKAPEIVGIQNERCESAENLALLVPSLRRALDENGFSSVKISTCNANTLKEGVEYLERFKQDPATWDAIDYTASNMYDYQLHLDGMDGFDPVIEAWNQQTEDKPFLSTEICINESPYQENSYHLAFATGILYHKNLVQMDAKAICYCWTLMDVTEPSYGYTRTLFTVDQQHGFVPVPCGDVLRVFGAFSRHILRGMHRIEVESGHADLLCSGYADGTKQTYLFLNQGYAPCQLNLARILTPGREWKFELCDPYHENDSLSLQDAEIELSPGAILTVYTE